LLQIETSFFKIDVFNDKSLTSLTKKIHRQKCQIVATNLASPQRHSFCPFIRADQSDFSFQHSWDQRDPKCFYQPLLVFNQLCKSYFSFHWLFFKMSLFPKAIYQNKILCPWRTFFLTFPDMWQPFHSYLAKWIDKKEMKPLTINPTHTLWQNMILWRNSWHQTFFPWKTVSFLLTSLSFNWQLVQVLSVASFLEPSTFNIPLSNSP